MGTKSLKRRRIYLTRYPVWLALCALPAIVACDDDDSGSLPGEIGNNRFFYGCSTIDDAHCRDELTSFPEKIAVGGRFEIVGKDDHGINLTTRPASPVLIESAGGEFEFTRAGFGAFLAFDFNEFVDFAHLEAVEVDDIDVLDSFGTPKDQLVLRRNQRTSITAVPLDAAGDTLAGSLVYRWVTDNDAVLTVETIGTTIEITALEVGTAQLRVSLGDDVSRVLNVVVEEAVSAPPSDAGTVTDAGSGDAATPDAATGDADTPDGGGTDPAEDGGASSQTSDPLDAGSDAPFDAGNGSTDSNTSSAAAALDGGQ